MMSIFLRKSDLEHIKLESREFMPVIINIDSAFDWTAEALQIWDVLDWEGIRQTTAMLRV